MKTVLTVALLAAAISPALAEQRSPLTPLPKIGAACPSGYQTSGGYCVPGPVTKCRAYPNPGGSVCATGYTRSFDFCVETGCQSR